jgi:hypothetical protein
LCAGAIGGVIGGERWKSLLTSYPPGGVEMYEREAAQGAGKSGADVNYEIVVVVAVGKWESQRDSQGGRAAVFSIARKLESRSHDRRPLLRSGA